MRWTRHGRIVGCFGAEGLEQVLLTLAQTIVRALLRLSPAERRGAAMRLTSLVLEGLDAVEPRVIPIPTREKVA